MHGWMHALMPWFIDMPQLAVCEEGTWAHATNFKQYENPLDTEETKGKHCQQTLTAKIKSLVRLFESLNMFPWFCMIVQYIAVYCTFFQLIPVLWMESGKQHFHYDIPGCGGCGGCPCGGCPCGGCCGCMPSMPGMPSMPTNMPGQLGCRWWGMKLGSPEMVLMNTYESEQSVWGLCWSHPLFSSLGSPINIWTYLDIEGFYKRHRVPYKLHGLKMLEDRWATRRPSTQIFPASIHRWLWLHVACAYDA